MSDNSSVKRKTIEWVLQGEDRLSGTFARAASNVKKSMKDMERASIPVSGGGGPLSMAFPKPTRAAEDQWARDIAAGRLRAQRKAADRERVNRQADRLLGKMYDNPIGPENRPEWRQDYARPIGPQNRSFFDQLFKDDVGGQGGGGGSGKGGGIARANRAAEESVSFFKGLKQQAKGIDSTLKLLRGGGALHVVSLLGEKMQGMPESIARYKEMLRLGATKGEIMAEGLADAIPVVGELARGFQAVGSSLKDWITGDDDYRREKAEKKEAEEARKRMVEAKNQRHDKAFGAIDEINAGLNEQFRFSGKTGAALEREQADAELEKEQARIAAVRGQKGGLGGDEQAAFQAKLDEASRAAEEIWNSKMNDIARAEEDRIDKSLEDFFGNVEEGVKEAGEKAAEGARKYAEESLENFSKSLQEDAKGQTMRDKLAAGGSTTAPTLESHLMSGISSMRDTNKELITGTNRRLDTLILLAKTSDGDYGLISEP